MVSSKRKRGGVTLCATCDPISKPRRVEILLREKLASAIDHPFSAADDTLFGQTCDVTKKRRPDLLWLGEDRCILVEVDERGGHSDPSYTPECDFGWAMDMVHCLVQLYRERGRNGGRVTENLAPEIPVSQPSKKMGGDPRPSHEFVRRDERKRKRV